MRTPPRSAAARVVAAGGQQLGGGLHADTADGQQIGSGLFDQDGELHVGVEDLGGQGVVSGGQSA